MCLVHIRPGVPASGGRWGGTGWINWTPRAAPCLAPPHHACPFLLPREEVAGGSGGGSPAALPAKGISGDEGGSCRLGWGLRTACLPRLLPEATKHRRLHQPLPGESWEAVVLSHPACVTSQKPPPQPPVRPLGRVLCWPGPSAAGGQRHPTPSMKGGPCWRVRVYVGRIQALGDPDSREPVRAPPAAVTPLSLCPAQDR